MRNFTTLPILALLAFVALATATEATKWQNAVKCGQRFDRINWVIDVFCRHSQDASEMRNGMYVPSEWAKQGIGMTGARGNRFVVKIEGNCQPAQYVPYDWCKAQFQQMCATTKNKWGYQTQSFGQNSCQEVYHRAAIESTSRHCADGQRQTDRMKELVSSSNFRVVGLWPLI